MRHLFAGITVVIALTACGGGGGGGGSTSPASTPTTPVLYTGVTTAAAISPTNASRLAENVVGGGESSVGRALSGVAIAGPMPLASRSSIVDAARGLARATGRLPLRAGASGAVAAAAVDQTEQCESGSVRLVGSLNDNGTGSLTITWSNCRDGTVTFNGQITLRVDAYDTANDMILDATMTFTRISYRTPTTNWDMSGEFRMQIDIPTRTETATLNLVFLNNANGEVLKVENLKFVEVDDDVFARTTYTQVITGRMYDRLHGFVDIQTPTALRFASEDDEFPQAGELLLTGSGATIRITALSTSLARLTLDLDGNGTADQVATLKWTDLSGPVGADLADTDGDGLHNSWETVNGLDPRNAADATQDKDGDNATNRMEYLAGSDPSSASSTPLSVPVSVTIYDSNDPIGTGSPFFYTVTVTNSGSAPATDLVLTDALPAALDLVSIQSGAGTCTGTRTVNCTLAILAPSSSWSLTITVMPRAQGLIGNTVSVTSTAYDANLTDNSASATTTVGLGTASIQALIDAASPGDTVLVGPGLYYGGLDFNFKNITLQSTDGPSTTIIHGNGGQAVRMGPAGAIKGFTLTGSSSMSGAAIQVFGSGSLISGNVFDGNVSPIGGFGAAIAGNATTSVTIDRNRFRNNTCDDQYIAGVIVFLNDSSATITNNVFDNNPCRAINLVIQNSPLQVIDNTFVGNRTAIGIYMTTSGAVFRNNIIVDNGTGVLVQFPNAVDPILANNLVFANTADYTGLANATGANGNISVDPLFVDKAAGDYRLRVGSPAIDAGSATGAPTADFNGAPRPVDGDANGSAVVDIGAFEKQ